MEFLKKLIAKLGLKEDASEDQVEAAVDTLIAKNLQLEADQNDPAKVVAKEVLAALDLEEGESASTVVASIHALKQSTKGSVSREEFEKIQKDLAARDAKEIVAKAMSDGKVTPDQKAWALEYAGRDLEGFKTFAAKAPVVIPVKDLPGKEEETDAVVNDTVLEVAKMMGNTREDIKQFGGLEA